ncbi:MAG: (2Fe-2S)-binding protein [Bacilli bacterium]|nr:(2Fe-2S)-binding protein [Bacilli bacterium]MBN2877467.1 (2Fe-2S)-binding protein [Bacilli bacterium]
MAKIKFQLNGKPVSLETDLNRRLLDVLREDFSLTGVKEGCGEGECGACAVLLDHEIVNSCSVPIANVMNKDIVTIEGYSTTSRYQVLREAFEEEGAVQCGFCTPGMMIASESLLHKNPNPTDEEIKIGLSGNLCRCTGYNMIIKAIKRAMKDGDGKW